jgi:hypothetical protein
MQTGNEFGNYILKPGAGQIRKPSWNRTETVVRLLPGPENGGWTLFKRSIEPGDFGDWLRGYSAIRNFGQKGLTFLLYDHVANPNYQIAENPCMVLYNAIQRSIDEKCCAPDWPALLKGGGGRSAILTKPKALTLSRCAFYAHKSKALVSEATLPLGLKPADKPAWIELTSTITEKLLSQIDEPKRDFQGGPTDKFDPHAYYAYGDIIALNHGAFVHIYEEGADPRALAQAAAAPTRRMSPGMASGRGGSGGGEDIHGYDCHLSDGWQGWSPDLSDFDQILRGKLKSWDDSLLFMTDLQQAHLIQDGFPASAIVYAFRDRPEWIKEETHDRLRNPVSANFPQGQGTPSPGYEPPTGVPEAAAAALQAQPGLRRLGAPSAPVQIGQLPPTANIRIDEAIPQTSVDDEQARAAAEYAAAMERLRTGQPVAN